MSLILCYVEPRFALIAADSLVTIVDDDGSTTHKHVPDKVMTSEGAILAICGQDRISRPARRVLAAEGALSGSGIRNALTNVRQHTRRMLYEESLEQPTPTTRWRLAESCVFATYTTRRGRAGPRACRIGVWNSHAWEQLTEVPPDTPTENGAARRCKELNAILARWHATKRNGTPGDRARDPEADLHGTPRCSPRLRTHGNQAAWCAGSASTWPSRKSCD